MSQPAGSPDLVPEADSAASDSDSPQKSHQVPQTVDHSDKYNDPRVTFTWRAWLTLLAILVFAIVFALASVHLRRTRLEKTTEFWGVATITAIQLGDHVMLRSLAGSDFEPVELTAFPGLGHLRKALLDERHYDWSTQSEGRVTDLCERSPECRCVRLEFSDPTLKRFEMAIVDIELEQGVVGPADQPKRVNVNDRVRPALQHQIGLLMRVKQKRYDFRTGEE